jgi:hypothetical protein
MQERSPIEILGAILDEVEGLRRTDAQSHLPEFLLREARAALEVGTESSRNELQITDLDGLQGRTISHVFDGDLKSASIVLLCTDGAYLALEIDGGNGDEFIKVDSLSRWGRASHGLADYLWPRQLVAAGLMSDAERIRLEHEEKTKALERTKKSSEEKMERLRKELADLEKSF